MTTLELKMDLQDLSKRAKAFSSAQLIEKVVKQGEGRLTNKGSIYTTTGKFTGRSPRDKFIVVEEESKDKVHWGKVNQSISKEHFLQLYKKVMKHMKQKDELFSFKGFVGADPAHRLSIEVINEYAWHNLFAHHLFIEPTTEELQEHKAEFTLVYAPTFEADPAVDGTNSETFIIVSFEEKIILIGGTEYAGEEKKAIFSVMNYLLPEKGIFPMHCSANIDEDGNTALFFGLSGTGKTTLSADEHRKLIGDDEHGWSDDGIFNIEGGCYAKTIHLSPEREPQIYETISYGTVLENVIVNEETRIPDYDDTSLTENTRAAYTLDAVENAVIPSVGGHPNAIIFLTADAFGVLPPISVLTKEQAMYHFISGYTSKLAGTERGITSPQVTFSSCFGEPFLPLNPVEYAQLLGEKLEKHDTKVFLVNTGWTGGGYGVGSRIDLPHTRKMIEEALSGALANTETTIDPIFGLAIPTKIDGIPDEVLNPINTWENKEEYNQVATELAHKFKENIKKFDGVSEQIIELGGPVI